MKKDRKLTQGHLITTQQLLDTPAFLLKQHSEAEFKISLVWDGICFSVNCTTNLSGAVTLKIKIFTFLERYFQGKLQLHGRRKKLMIFALHDL